eukprot:6210030-Pleurochrysis_carterae.AAC.1
MMFGRGERGAAVGGEVHHSYVAVLCGAAGSCGYQFVRQMFPARSGSGGRPSASHAWQTGATDARILAPAAAQADLGKARRTASEIVHGILNCASGLQIICAVIQTQFIERDQRRVIEACSSVAIIETLQLAFGSRRHNFCCEHESMKAYKLPGEAPTVQYARFSCRQPILVSFLSSKCSAHFETEAHP